MRNADPGMTGDDEDEAGVLAEKLRAIPPSRPSSAVEALLADLRLSDHEQYLFETSGFVVVPDAIPPLLLAELNAAIDANQHRTKVRGPDESLDGRHNSYHSIADSTHPHHAGVRSSPTLEDTHGRADFGNPLLWERPHRRPFIELLTLPTTMRWMLGSIGDEFLLVDAGGFVQSTGAEGFGA